MSFLVATTLRTEKWFEVLICALSFAILIGCATTELAQDPRDKKVLAQKKFKEALEASSLNQIDKVMILLEEAVDLDPADPNIHFYFGKALVTKKKFGKAEQEFLSSLKLNNDLKDSYRQLGLIYMRQRLWGKAIENFKEDLARPGTLNPQQVYNWLALCFYNLGKKNEAETEWIKALDIKDNAGIRLNLALAYINQERFNEATDFLQKALAVRPRFSQAHFELAQLFLKKGKRDKAQAHFRKVIIYSPRGKLAKKSKEYLQLISPKDKNHG